MSFFKNLFKPSAELAKLDAPALENERERMAKLRRVPTVNNYLAAAATLCCFASMWPLAAVGVPYASCVAVSLLVSVALGSTAARDLRKSTNFALSRIAKEEKRRAGTPASAASAPGLSPVAAQTIADAFREGSQNRIAVRRLSLKHKTPPVAAPG